jgi:inner membrane protein
MATVAHVAAGLVIGRVHASTTRSPLLGSLLLLPVLAVLPDLDVFVGRVLVAAAPALAHRGATHSLGAAVIVGMLVWLVLPRGGRHFPPLETAVAAAIACASNGLLDLLSAGGESVAVFWPILDARFFGTWRPIPDAPFESLLATAHGFRCLTLETAGCLPVIVWALSKRSSRGVESLALFFAKWWSQSRLRQSRD